MAVLRGVIGVFGAIVLGACVWATFAHVDLHGGFFDQFGVVTALPWGKVMLIDLYVGFVFFALVVWLTEGSVLKAVLWAAPVFVLGNLWSAVWFAWRMPVLYQRLKQSSN